MDKAQQETIADHMNTALEFCDAADYQDAIESLILAVAELAGLTKARGFRWRVRESEEVAVDKLGADHVNKAKEALADLESARGPVTKSEVDQVHESGVDLLASSIHAYGPQSTLRNQCAFCEVAPELPLKFLADGERFCSATCVLSYRQHEDQRVALQTEFPISVQRQPNNTFRVLVGRGFGTLEEADAFLGLLALRIDASTPRSEEHTSELQSH